MRVKMPFRESVLIRVSIQCISKQKELVRIKAIVTYINKVHKVIVAAVHHRVQVLVAGNSQFAPRIRHNYGVVIIIKEYFSAA